MNTIVEQTETTEISFGDKLRQTREALNLSLEDVAKSHFFTSKHFGKIRK